MVRKTRGKQLEFLTTDFTDYSDSSEQNLKIIASEPAQLFSLSDFWPISSQMNL
jgi:hypothetical protein